MKKTNQTGWYEVAKQTGVYPASAARGVCSYLGEQTGLRDCASCGGNKTKIKVFACGHENHTSTTWPECQRCSDFQPKS